jgi:hypothetical protein
VNGTGWSRGLEVTGGGSEVVSHAGLVLLRQLSDKTGLTARLSQALPSPLAGRGHPAGVAQAAGPGWRPRQGRAQDAAVPDPARRRPSGARRAAQIPENRLLMALGRGDHHRLAAHQGHPASPLTSSNSSQRAGKETPGPVKPPATRPDSRAAVIPRH